MKSMEEKPMKKNRPMRAAGIIFAAVILTTSLTAGTLAKYTTTAGACDSARAARFGVTVTANGSLYGQEYDRGTNGGSNKPIAFSSDLNTGTVQVSSSADGKIIAPGTESSGSGLGFGINGSPEVDVRITGSVEAESIFLKAGSYGVMLKKPAGLVTGENFASLTSGDNAEELFRYDSASQSFKKVTAFDSSITQWYVLQNKVTLESNYYPVVYSLSGGDDDVSASGSGTETNTADVAAGCIAAQLSNAAADTDDSEGRSVYVFSRTVESNTDIASALKLSSMRLTWKWDYSRDAAADSADTILGDLQAQTDDSSYTVVKKQGNDYKAPAADSDYHLTTSFSLTVTAEQKD